MKLPTLILIDSQYLYYQLMRFGIREIDMDWPRFFFKIAGTKALITVKWFRPLELRPISINEKVALKKLAERKYRNRKEDLLFMFSTKKLPRDILHEVRNEKREAIKWLKTEQQRFSEIGRIYESIAHKYSRICKELKIEICTAGGLKVDPFEKKRITEKGVDMAMTTYLMDAAFKKDYTSIILLSANKDLVIPIEKIKDRNIEIQAVTFQNQHSKDTQKKCAIESIVDKVQYFSEKEIKAMLVEENVPNLYDEKVFKEKIKELIAHAEIVKALESTAAYIDKYKPGFKDDIIALQTQWVSLERDRIKGILTNEEYSRSRQGIYHKLLSLLGLL